MSHYYHGAAEIRAESQDYGNGVGIYIRVRDHREAPWQELYLDHKTETYALRATDPDRYEISPTLMLRRRTGEAQQLMDDLWRAGLRPTEQGTAGQLSATESHLQDMRKIAFDLLEDLKP